ncbi:MAG TPA: hypothetical protein QKA14_00635, partial [Candidatus Megaira endosymbiont of Hartmannula sinica]|nr:hypothetical protein [Candidatus Megaera endosymbiont of Hartmannula sinica]
ICLEKNIDYDLKSIDVYPKIESNKQNKIFIVDTLGELGNIYSIASLVFVGGSLNKGCAGGHNIIEPMMFKKPVVVGKETSNFSDVINDLYNNKGIFIIKDGLDLKKIIINFLLSKKNNNNIYTEYANKSFNLVKLKKQKIKDRYFSLIDKYIN